VGPPPPVRASAIAALLLALAASPAAADPPTPRAGLGLEYSTFLDAHRETALRYGARSAVSAFGVRAEADLAYPRFRLGLALTFFPSSSLALSPDLFLTWTRRWRRVALDLGGGLGYLFTLDGTMVPTYTGTRSGPSLHLRGLLSCRLAWRLFAEAGLGFYLYPLQPMLVIPVGIDLRWHVGLAVTLG
jgi:hypothetical protein